MSAVLQQHLPELAHQLLTWHSAAAHSMGAQQGTAQSMHVLHLWATDDPVGLRCPTTPLLAAACSDPMTCPFVWPAAPFPQPSRPCSVYNPNPNLGWLA
jgi:hypothetical protein